MSDEHDHEHDGEYGHDHGQETTDEAPDDPRPRARALQSLLTEKGIISSAAVDETITAYEEDVGPQNGARVVARAWTDSAFKERLLSDANEALAAFDFEVGVQRIEVKENIRRFTTRSFVRSVPVILGRCWDFRRRGTRRPNTGPGWFGNRVPSSESSGSNSTTMSRCRSGIQVLRSATWYFRNDRSERRDAAKSNLSNT